MRAFPKLSVSSGPPRRPLVWLFQILVLPSPVGFAAKKKIKPPSYTHTQNKNKKPNKQKTRNPHQKLAVVKPEPPCLAASLQFGCLEA